MQVRRTATGASESSVGAARGHSGMTAAGAGAAAALARRSMRRDLKSAKESRRPMLATVQDALDLEDSKFQHRQNVAINNLVN